MKQILTGISVLATSLSVSRLESSKTSCVCHSPDRFFAIVSTASLMRLLHDTSNSATFLVYCRHHASAMKIDDLFLVGRVRSAYRTKGKRVKTTLRKIIIHLIFLTTGHVSIRCHLLHMMCRGPLNFPCQLLGRMGSCRRYPKEECRGLFNHLHLQALTLSGPWPTLVPNHRLSRCPNPRFGTVGLCLLLQARGWWKVSL